MSKLKAILYFLSFICIALMVFDFVSNWIASNITKAWMLASSGFLLSIGLVTWENVEKSYINKSNIIRSLYLVLFFFLTLAFIARYNLDFCVRAGCSHR